MGIILDTSILIDLLAGDRHAESAVAAAEFEGQVPVLSSVAAFEALAGVEFTKSKTERARLETMFRQLPLEDFTLDAARAAAELRAELRRVGRSPSAPDVMIAGQAVAGNHTLITGDRILAGSCEALGLAVILVD